MVGRVVSCFSLVACGFAAADDAGGASDGRCFAPGIDTPIGGNPERIAPGDFDD